MYILTHTYIHTYIHTYMHTYILGFDNIEGGVCKGDGEGPLLQWTAGKKR